MLVSYRRRRSVNSLKRGIMSEQPPPHKVVRVYSGHGSTFAGQAGIWTRRTRKRLMRSLLTINTEGTKSDDGTRSLPPSPQRLWRTGPPQRTGIGRRKGGLGLGVMIKIRIRMATPPHPCMILLQLCAIAGVSGAIPVQFRCNCSAICACDWGQLAATWGDSKLATLIVIGRGLAGRATGCHK